MYKFSIILLTQAKALDMLESVVATLIPSPIDKICFPYGLLFSRRIQKRTENKHSSEKILDSLSKSCCTNFYGNQYVFDYNDHVLDDIGKAVGIDFGIEFRTLEEIKKIISQTKTH